MFACGLCHEQSEPNERPERVVVETREKMYPERFHAHPYRRTNTKLYRDDPGGVGSEVVKEVIAHVKCARDFYAGRTKVADGVFRRAAS